MDKYDVIDKARNALIQHLSNDERLMFAELTPEHQRYLVSWEARYLDNECPDGVSIEDCIQQDIDGCIGHLKNTIGKLMNTDEGKEQWEEWLGLKTRIRDVLEINELVNLLYYPFEVRATGKKKGMHYFVGRLLAGILANEGYIEPYRYPWQTMRKNTIFKEAGLVLPDVYGWTQRDREMYFSELPIQIKIYALIKINDLEATAKHLSPGGWLHPAKMIPVWRSYIPTFTTETLLPVSPAIEMFPDKKPETQEQIERWNRKVEEYYQPTGKFKFHAAICRKISMEEGSNRDPKHIANETRATYHRLKGK